MLVEVMRVLRVPEEEVCVPREAGSQSMGRQGAAEE